MVAKEFSQLSPAGRKTVGLWLKSCSTNADVAETERKTFPAVVAVSGLQFQPSATTMDHYCNCNTTYDEPLSLSVQWVHGLHLMAALSAGRRFIWTAHCRSAIILRQSAGKPRQSTSDQASNNNNQQQLKMVQPQKCGDNCI